MDSEEPLVCLILWMIGKSVDLSDFDRGQIFMTQRLRRSISETALLVDCSQTTTFSISVKQINGNEIRSK